MGAQPEEDRRQIRIGGKQDELVEPGLVIDRVVGVEHHVQVRRVAAMAGHRRAIDHLHAIGGENIAILAQSPRIGVAALYEDLAAHLIAGAGRQQAAVFDARQPLAHFRRKNLGDLGSVSREAALQTVKVEEEYAFYDVRHYSSPSTLRHT